MHLPGWEDVSLPDLVESRLGLPATLENDGDAAALGEWTHGAGRGARDLVYLQVSTGVGSGLVLDGELRRGSELGHVTAEEDGRVCPCGKRGCLETVAAGWALARDGRDAKAVIDAARAGDAEAGAVVARAFAALGTALANVVNLLAPEVVVVGGGVAQAADLLFPALERGLERGVVPHLRGGTRLEAAQLGADAPLVGAAVAAHRSTAG
jgi:glucokinase